jgi:hypothetical protein
MINSRAIVIRRTGTWDKGRGTSRHRFIETALLTKANGIQMFGFIFLTSPRQQGWYSQIFLR